MRIEKCSYLGVLVISFIVSTFVRQTFPMSSNTNQTELHPEISQLSLKKTGANTAGFMSKKAHLSGIRIEPDEPGGTGFVGYTEKGVSIVVPDTTVRVVFFGSYLDEIIKIGFTSNDDCSNPSGIISQEDFTIQTDKRIVVLHEFHESSSIFKICIKQEKYESNGEEVFHDLPFTLVDDLRTFITTDTPPRKYYFPMGFQIGIVAFLLVLSGLFSGLNLGLMSLTPQELTLISNSGSPKERKYAQTILPVRKSGNLLLCSLLIGNVCVNSGISILFDDLTSGYVALVVSSAGIVIFGEIFPQALCVKKGLAVGARTIWVTRFFMVLTFPLAYPISRILDCVLGEEVVSYDRKRLMELIKMSTKNAGTAEELKIAIGAMEIADKTVSDVMTKIDDVFMLREDTILNTKMVAEILRSGYTRIPIYSENRNNVVSLLFVKDLALLDPDDNFTVKTVCGYHEHALRMVMEDTPLRVMLEEFKKGDYHLAMVQKLVEHPDKDNTYELVGIVTLEDIVEEILQAEIVDETDAIMDNVNRTRRRRTQGHEFNLVDAADSGQCSISMQMQLVTVQWLITNHRAFNPDKIAPSILEKVIRKHVHKVEVTHLAMDMNDGTNMVFPRTSKLYTKQETSDKFVLILEGRAMVTIGQNQMTFEAGPWHCFGTELLDRLNQLVEHQQQQQPPNFHTVASITSTATIKGTAVNPQQNATRSSQGALQQIPTGGSTNTMVQQQMLEFDAKKITFQPDYSAVIRDECTYLEITAQTYLLAYKSTLISKNKTREGAGGGHVDSFRSHNGFGLGGAAASMNAIGSDGTPVLMRALTDQYQGRQSFTEVDGSEEDEVVLVANNHPNGESPQKANSKRNRADETSRHKRTSSDSTTRLCEERQQSAKVEQVQLEDILNDMEMGNINNTSNTKVNKPNSDDVAVRL